MESNNLLDLTPFYLLKMVRRGIKMILTNIGYIQESKIVNYIEVHTVFDERFGEYLI